MTSSPLSTPIRATRRIPNSTRGEPRIGRFGMPSARRGGGFAWSELPLNMPSWTGRIECLKNGRRLRHGTSHEELTPKQEIKAIKEAMKLDDWPFFERYGGRNPALTRLLELFRMPAANVTEGVSIDDYDTWRAGRFADQNETG